MTFCSTTCKLRPRGVTLIEVLIAASLTIVLLAMFFSVLVPTFRYTSRDSVRVEIEQAAIFASRRMERDLQQTVPAGLSILSQVSPSDPAAFSAVKFTGLTASGTMGWEERAVLYYWTPSEGKLFYKLWPPAPPADVGLFSIDRPTRLPSVLLHDIVSQSNGTERSIAHDVAFFKAEHAEMPAGSGLFNDRVCRVTLRLESDAPYHQGPMTFELKRDFYLRNSL